MNVVLWILQAGLALLCLSGGAYKAFKFAELANLMRALPHGGWRALGVLEMACGLLLIVPAATSWMPMLTVLAAAVLTVECVGLTGLYARYSRTLTAANPLVWSVAMGLMAVFVAFGRYALSPLA